jgi:hypothetical protein
VVVVVVALVDGVTPLVVSVELVPVPGPPMAPLPVVVDPGVAVPALPLVVEPGEVVPPVLLPLMALELPVPPVPLEPGVPVLLLDVDVSLLGDGVVVVDELEDDVEGVGA